MKKIKIICLLALVWMSAAKVSAQPGGANRQFVPYNVVQMALLLDVSGSMSGLISQAKTEVWNLVNEVGKAQKRGQTSRLEIALYVYGGTGNRHLLQLMDFTSDLDTISKSLFAQNTDGGEEYCGEITLKAVKELQWRESDSVYKVIFIAGNEPFSQGGTNYLSAMDSAKKHGIVVNTIHCGDEQTGIREMWKDGAYRALGKYFWINQNQAFVRIETPYDKTLDSLNSVLNSTYVYYGRVGRSYKENQVIQDANMKSMAGSGYFDRVKSKSAKAVYSNSKWDLLDRYTEDSNSLKEMLKEGIDTSYHVKTLADLKKLVDSLALRRAEIQKQITAYTALRDQFIATIPKSGSKDKTLGEALVQALHEQAALHGFVFN